jgi:hypothetical protein
LKHELNTQLQNAEVKRPFAAEVKTPSKPQKITAKSAKEIAKRAKEKNMKNLLQGENS